MSNQLKYKDQSFSTGDTIAVHQLVTEGDKDRVQIFEGVLIAVKGREQNQSFMVRKIAAGAIGVERIWPVHSPRVTAIKLIKSGQSRRAKLYYLRGRKGKEASKVKELVENQVVISKPKTAKPKPSATKKAQSAKPTAKRNPRRAAGKKTARE